MNEALAAATATASGITFVDLQEREIFTSFQEIHLRAGQAAAGLADLGVAPGDRVALVLPTSPSFLDAYFGTLLAGAVPVPLYPPFRLGRLDEYHESTARMIARVGARVVVADSQNGRLLGPIVERSRVPLGCRDINDLVHPGSAGLARDVEPDSLGLIQFSSGSTSDPRPVALSHRNLVAQLSALSSLLAPEEDVPGKGVSWLPLYHDMGLIGCLLLAVYYPGPLVLIPPEHFLVRPALWLRALSRHRGTLSVAPNFGYAVCARRVKDADLAGLDLSAWRAALCGAEPVALDVLERFAQRFAAVGFDARALRPVYGLAEASLAVTFTPPRYPVKALGVDSHHLARTGDVVDGARHIVSVGTPVPGFEVEVRDADGRPVQDRKVGRIAARGPSVMVGYFGEREAGGTLDDGWLDTGDLGFVADGELYVCGREKDVIIIRGANHAPQEFEDCLDGLDGIRSGRVVALGFVPEGQDGEQLLLLAERSIGLRQPGSDEALAALVRRVVLERTGIRPYAVQIVEPGTLPRTSSGKLRRNEALRRFLEGN